MPAPSRPLGRGLVLLMATATGLAVSCNYYAQPLLNTIAAEFGITHGVAGLIVTLGQLAYALGLLFIVPLGDILERRGLIVLLMLGAALGLVVLGLAPGLGMAIAGAVLIGLTSVVAQVLLPLAAALATPQERGRTVGTLMSGLIAGILLGRTFAGAASELGGWRLVYAISAPLLVLMAWVLWRHLPVRQAAATGLTYPRLIASVFQLMREDRALRLRSLLGGISFAGFCAFWAPLAFLLAAPPYGYDDLTIGLFGLVGMAGVLGASLAGRQADRGHGAATTLSGLGLLLAGWGMLAFAGSSLAALLAGVVVIDLAMQLAHVSNQAVIYRNRPEARSRVTSAYMTSYFIGAGAGTFAGTMAFALAGWPGVTAVGVGCSALALGLGFYTVGRGC